MKKILILLLFVLVIVISGIYVSAAPFRWYSKSYSDKEFKSEWFTLIDLPLSVYQAKQDVLSSKNYDTDLAYDEYRWKNVHISDFDIPMPYRHPLVRFYPQMRYSGKTTEIGFSLTDLKGELLQRVTIEQHGSFDYHLDRQKLFSYPIIKDKLNAVPAYLAFRDMLSKNLDLPNKSYGELIYNLMILNLRKIYFDSEVTSSLFYSDIPNIGIFVLQSSDPDILKERIMLMEKGVLYSLMLQTSSKNQGALYLRKKFIESLILHPSDEGAVDIGYKEFQTMDYNDKMSDQGLLQLFSIWSHNPAEANILQEMIDYAERSGSRAEILKTLYGYSLARFNKTFAKRNVNVIGEDVNLYLHRKIEQEVYQQDEKLKNEEVKAKESLTEEQIYRQRLERSKSESKTKSINRLE